VATRNLARTVVEGGQAGYCKALRRFENRVERRLRFDEEGNVIAGRARLPMTKCFADRLAPLRRWLARHVGRGWNNVYREFCESFDRRTVKGWHLDDHIRQMVDSRYSCFPRSFYVDDRGILRRCPGRIRKGKEPGVRDADVCSWGACELHGEGGSADVRSRRRAISLIANGDLSTDKARRCSPTTGRDHISGPASQALRGARPAGGLDYRQSAFR
jgi:hypothetical protein